MIDKSNHPAHNVFPLFLNLSGRLAVVVGGGEVGRRRAQAVLAGGGRVRVISLEAKPADVAFAEMDWRAEPYQESHLGDGYIVFAAATAEVNHQVLRDARSRGLLVNVADDPAASDFIMPATRRRGPLTVAVSTAGAAPTAAQAARLLLEETFDEAFIAWVETLADVRLLVRRQVAKPPRRRQILRRLAERSWLERFRKEGSDEARRLLHAEALRLVSAAERPL